MPSTTTYNFGDIVLITFPFTNQVGSKKRPAVVVSSDTYYRKRQDVILMAVTSQVHRPPSFGEALIQDWQGAGLLKPSAIKPVVFTAEKRIVLKRLGQLKDTDQQAVREVIGRIIG
ncbi:MAG: type II toxin-antitoxin system PemK/MazF family toxin [Chromatiaceae bacterium]|jgi:mRNA interferase MazF